MKEELKKAYREFVSWVKYVREYKDNKDNDSIYDQNIVAKQKEIEKLKKSVKDKEYVAKTKDELIALLEKRVGVLGGELTNTKKRNNELRNTISILYRQNEDLQIEVEKKELLRRKKAGQIGGYTKEINKLKQELEKANHKINWLKTNQKAPTKEEIIAYETRMKEVEKRLKDGRSDNNI